MRMRIRKLIFRDPANSQKAHKFVISRESMIGLFKTMDSELSQAKTDEDPETRNLDKSQLYEMVTEKNFLPPLHSRGITRDYLLSVYKDEVYKVGLQTLKQFEVNLNQRQTKKVGIVNSALLMRKLNLLLKSRRENDLGFDEYDPPDQVTYLKLDMAVESG
jgi:hypothetical protein